MGKIKIATTKRNTPYFLPKSAGISPHIRVSHLSMGFLYEFDWSQRMASSRSPKSFAFLLFLGCVVLATLFLTHAIAVTLSV